MVLFGDVSVDGPEVHPQCGLIAFQQQQLLIQIFLPALFDPLEHALIQFMCLSEATQLRMLLVLLHLALMQDDEPKLILRIEVPDDLQLFRRGLDLSE